MIIIITNKTKQTTMKKSFILLCCSIFLGGSGLFAQQGSVAAGGDATGSGGSASYTLGQIDYISASGTDGSLTQGIQQPFEIVTEIMETELSINAELYPNPSTENVVLTVANSEYKNMHYQMCDVNGRVIKTGQVVNDQAENITMSGLTTGNYFLRIYSQKQELKSFKIIKNQ